MVWSKNHSSFWSEWYYRLMMFAKMVESWPNTTSKIIYLQKWHNVRRKRSLYRLTAHESSISTTQNIIRLLWPQWPFIDASENGIAASIAPSLVHTDNWESRWLAQTMSNATRHCLSRPATTVSSRTVVAQSSDFQTSLSAKTILWSGYYTIW